ncbi:MAG: TetR family transcriptional regulator [Alistipes senegalensis]|nr:TetR family transcriptional regulator [Oxalobacter formigenes]MCM1280828.1 TetR family transcriptional regulator [Alistipes senegalensis]
MAREKTQFGKDAVRERRSSGKTIETRNRLLDAAEQVFYEKGVSNTTLNDIAEAAGVTRGAVYWHFTNKVDVFNAMVDRVRQPIRQMIDEIADEETEDPLGRLREKSVFLMREIQENAHYRKVLGILYHRCEFTEKSSEYQVSYREWMTRARETLTRVLGNARQKGQLPGDIDIGLSFLAVHVVFNGLLHSWLLTPDRFDLHEEARRLFDATFFMLRNSPHMRTGS